MSRSMTLIGLNPRAFDWLHENCVKLSDRKCPNCDHVLSYKLKSENIDFDEQFYCDGVQINRYWTKDGKTVVNYVQESPWDSGPTVFEGLKWEDTEEPVEGCIWTKEEVSAQMGWEEYE